MGEVVFAKNNPVKSYTVTVIVPKEIELRTDVINGKIKPKVTEKSGNTVYRWTINNIDPVLTEPGRISVDENQAKLVFSTFQDWDALFEYFAGNIDQSEQFTIAMQQKINDLTEGLSNPFENIQKIRDFVADQTGSARLAPAFTGYKIKDAMSTYQENSGTTLDKAVLLSSMLNVAGFDAYVSFVSKSASFSDAVPSLAQFNDLVVTTRWTNGETHILSPVHSQTNSLDADLSEKYLFRLDKKLKKIQPIKSFSEKTNFQKMILNLELCEELKFSGKGTVNFGGKYHPYYTLKDQGKASIVIGGSLGNLNTAKEKVTMLDMQEATVVADLSTDEMEVENTYIYWELPEFSHGFNNSHIVTALTDRKTTLDLQNPVTEKYCFTIKLPENVTLASPEFKEYEKCNIGNVTVKLEKENNIITIERALVIKSDHVTPENYPEFRNMIKIWENSNYQHLIFKVSE